MGGNDCIRIKIRWKPKDGGYTRDDLERFFSRHGRISGLVVSSSKPGSAMVEFEEAKAAQSAMKYVKGFPGSPLTLSWPDGTRQPTTRYPATSTPPAQETESSASRSAQDDADFEAMVFAKMRAHAKEQRAKAAAAQEPNPAE